MQQIFEAKAPRQGGVVGRKLRDIERHVSRAAVERGSRRRGAHAATTSGRAVIVCNNAPVRVLC